LRLARAVGRGEPSEAGVGQRSPDAEEFLVDEAKPPRCIAYLSIAGDVITLELTSEPKFTEADIEAVAALLSNRRQTS
jgi:hypothetical protein